jgi:hypothetical protein
MVHFAMSFHLGQCIFTAFRSARAAVFTRCPPWLTDDQFARSVISSRSGDYRRRITATWRDNRTCDGEHHAHGNHPPVYVLGTSCAAPERGERLRILNAERGEM